MRVAEKVLTPATGDRPTRVQRRDDRPRTPFNRLCETDAISDQQRQRLMALRESINPGKLRREIYALCDALFSLPNAVPGIAKNLHHTLHYPCELEMPNEDSHQPSAIAQSCPSTYNDR